MRTLITMIGTMVPATAFAATNAAGNDGVFVWIFLGFFATIVVGQLVPAAILLIGLVKGITAKNEAKVEVR